jgi:hypothetical protein
MEGNVINPQLLSDRLREVMEEAKEIADELESRGLEVVFEYADIEKDTFPETIKVLKVFNY